MSEPSSLSSSSSTMSPHTTSPSSARSVWFDAEDLLLRVYVQPKASRDKVIGLHGDEVKIAITAPPIDGKANAYLAKYLAKQFKVAKSQVHVEKGELGRHKQIRIVTPTLIPQEIQAIL